MIAFTKEGSCASFWALLTSWSQYLWYKTNHSKEQRVHQRENGRGTEWKISLHYRALCGCPIDAGYLLTGLLKDKQCRLWSTRETGLEGKVPDSRNKFLPRFAGLTGHKQLRQADSLLQGPQFRGQSLASRAMAVGSLHAHRCTGNTGLQSGLSLGSTWMAEHAVSGEESQKNPEEGKNSPQTFSPMWKFSLFLPFSLMSVLTLAALLQGAGSDLLEAPSTCHLVLISVCDQF